MTIQYLTGIGMQFAEKGFKGIMVANADEMIMIGEDRPGFQFPACGDNICAGFA